jgi:hypothetical protein
LVEALIFLDRAEVIVCGGVHHLWRAIDLPPLSKVSEGAHFRKLEADFKKTCSHAATTRSCDGRRLIL